MCAKGRIAVVLYGLFWLIKIRKIPDSFYPLTRISLSYSVKETHNACVHLGLGYLTGVLKSGGFRFYQSSQ